MSEDEVCIDFDSDIREERARRLGLPSLSGTGERVSMCGEKEDPGWKDVHYDYYVRLGVPWPPAMSEAPHISIDGVRAREQQVVFLCDKIWPQADEVQHEYLDVNPKLEMVLQAFVATDQESGNLLPKKSPWRASPRTIVGSTKLLLRYKEGAGEPVVIRATEASEYMRLIGWDDQQWSAPAPADMLALDQQRYTELCANFAGNAWSAWHWLPLRMATVATAGYFSVAREQEDQQQKQQHESEKKTELGHTATIAISESDSDSD